MKPYSVSFLCTLLGVAFSANAEAAGSVSVSISGETTYITGDALDNKIKMSDSDNDGTWEIAGSGGTLVNGVPVFFTTVAGNVRISMGDGKDSVGVDSTQVPGSLEITLGIGSDKATVSDTTIGYDFDVNGEAGDDKLSIKHVGVAHRCEFYMDTFEAGKDNVKIKDLTGVGITIVTESGDDKVTVQDVALPLAEFPFLYIGTGGDKDKVGIKTVDTYYLTIELSEDDDSLKIGQSRIDYSDLDGGNGTGDKLVVDEDSNLGSGTPVGFEE